MTPTTTQSDLASNLAGTSTPLAAEGSPHASTAARAGNGHDRVHRWAGTVHRAIDSLEQRLNTAGGGMSSTRSRYGERAREYRESMGSRMAEQPLQALGIVLAAGVLLDRLFLRTPKVRVIGVPVRHVQAPRETSPAMEQRVRHWADAADAHAHRAGRTAEQAAGRARLAAAAGLAGTRAAASRLAHEAQVLPMHMRTAAQHLMARSQAYGSRARATVESHPWVGLGAVLAASGLLTTALLQRRDTESDLPYLGAGARSRVRAWPRSGYDPQTGLGDTIASRPVTASLLVLGLGVLAGVMLGRRME